MDILSSIDYYLTLASENARPTIGASPSNFFLLAVRVAHKVLSLSEAPEDISRRIWFEDASLAIEGKMGVWASNKKPFRVGRG